jgi:DNA-binding response OmpR family regulator
MSVPAAGGRAGVRVLVVEDEAAIRRVVVGYLHQDGFEVFEAADGLRAVEMAREVHPDVVVLDLMLPGLDGVEVCRQLRTFSDAYVVMLTARHEEIDKLIGLSVGADDYLTKPFSPRELIARIRAMLRRPRAEAQPAEVGLRVFGDLTIDPVAREVTVAGQPVALTRTEFDILDALSAAPRQAYARRSLVSDVWGADWFGDDHLVDVHIAHLRAKLADDTTHPRYILTVRGVGYRMGPG